MTIHHDRAIGELYALRMAKHNKKKHEAKAMSELVKGLRAVGKRIEEGKLVVPEDIADDPQAILEYMREKERRTKRARRWQ